MSETLLGVIIGGLLVTVSNVVVAIVQADRTAALDKDKRSDDRRIERDRMQRDWLLELQERLAEWMRVQGQIYHADHQALKTGKMSLLPDVLSEADLEASRRLMYLTERIRDDDLRQALSDLRGLAAEGEARRAVDHEHVTVEQLEDEFQALVARGYDVQTALGRVLRSYL